MTQMTGNLDTIPSFYAQVVRCPHCGKMCPAEEKQCPNCGEVLPPSPVTTRHVHSALPVKHSERQGIVQFEMEDSVSLHIADSPITIELSLDKPLVLGRKILPDNEERLDLSEFNAFLHGVSRCHCRLQRQSKRLILTDLGSSNGTYLNDDRLMPYTHYLVAHGDCLRLGTLCLGITFGNVTD